MRLLIGTTDERGLLTQALLRRFLLKIELDSYTEPEIVQILIGNAERLGWPLDLDAAAELACYARRNPGTAHSLLSQARKRAMVTTAGRITAQVVSEVIERQGLYPLALTKTDVRVLQLLSARRKGMGMAEICRAAGISQSEFSGLVEPYLRLLGYVETLHRRFITPSGLAYLARLKLVDTARPDVRAAVAHSGTNVV